MSVESVIEQARTAEQRGNPALAISLYDDALEKLEKGQPGAQLADVLRWKGSLLRENGDTEGAYRAYLRSFSVAEKASATDSKAHAVNCLAIIAQRRGDLREAERLYTNAAELAQEVGDNRLLGMIEQNRGVLANMRGDFASAERRYDKSLAAFDKAQDLQAVSWVLNNQGMLHTKRGQYDDARRVLQRALDIAKSREDTQVEGIVALNLAEVWIGIGELDLAARACAEALEDAQERGDHLTAAEALKCRAKIECKRGAYDDGLATLRIARYQAEGSQDQLLLAEILRELGEVSRASGDGRAARTAWTQAVDTFEGLGASFDAADLKTRLKALPA
jgi:ATP-dependent transcriptional regulator